MKLNVEQVIHYIRQVIGWDIFFEEILQKDNFIDILASFMFVEEEGVGHNYLIQHSAGIGKTKSIAWLSQRKAKTNPYDRD